MPGSRPMRNLVFVLAPTALLAGGALLAQEARHAQGGTILEKFRQLDRNGDGRVTAEEMGSPEWHRRLDLDGDGFVTLEEARRTLAGSDGPDAADRGVYHKDSAGPVPLAEGSAFTDLVFARDWVPGSKDSAGRLMTGTECDYLVAHGGRLYAAVGVWHHDEGGGPNPGPIVLVKKGAASPWEVDLAVGPRSVRVPALAALELTTDAQGKRLAEPVHLLVAGLSGSGEPASVMVRDDASGTWTRSVVTRTRARSFEVRLLFTHLDLVTNVHGIFAAMTSGSVHRGAFDPASPGRIRWDLEPELEGRVARIMSSGQANGDAYLAVDITSARPRNGGLFRRVDGERPQWEWLGEWGTRFDHRGVAWMRGLTAIPDPKLPDRELLLASREVDGVIEVIDPAGGHSRRVEFDLRKHFGGLVGARDGQRVTTIFAYNEMTPAVHPDTGERVLLIGGGVMPQPAGEDARARGAFYLVRHADGRYGTGRVFDPAFVPPPFGGLRCVRTICSSPFPEDCGRVFYFGGFDAGDFGTGARYRDTAWIYRGTLPAAGGEERQ